MAFDGARRLRSDAARAGSTPRRKMQPEPASAAALDAGERILAGGGSSLDAVEAAARVLEDDPVFNAGRGSVLNYEGGIDLDAAIMDGRSPRRGRGRRPQDHPLPDQPGAGGDGAWPARPAVVRRRRGVRARAWASSRSTTGLVRNRRAPAPAGRRCWPPAGSSTPTSNMGRSARSPSMTPAMSPPPLRPAG